MHLQGEAQGIDVEPDRSIDIVNDSGDDFAIAQLRQGNSGVIPEPGTMALLGTGLLGALGMIRRKINL